MTRCDKAGQLELVKTDSLGRVQTTPEQREAILDAYEAGGLSGPKFAEVHGINYQTFAGWRHKRQQSRSRSNRQSTKKAKKRNSKRMTLVEALPGVPSSSIVDRANLLIELPGGSRMVIADRAGVDLAVELLRALGRTETTRRQC